MQNTVDLLEISANLSITSLVFAKLTCGRYPTATSNPIKLEQGTIRNDCETYKYTPVEMPEEMGGGFGSLKLECLNSEGTEVDTDKPVWSIPYEDTSEYRLVEI